MKTKLHTFRTIATMLISTLLFYACLKDDRSICPEEIQVYFTFPTTINPADIDRMHLYIFNDKGYFLDEYRDDNITNFSTEYYITCTGLLPANYRFIAWGGKDELYYSTSPLPFTKGETTFDEALLMLKHPGGVVLAPPHHIFHSDLEATVVYGHIIQRFYMPLAQLSNTINISTIGLPASANAYTFNIKDNNCSYKFDRSFASHSHGTFTYTAPCTKDGAGQLHSTLKVMRLSADRRTPRLEIYNETTGAPLYPVGTQSGDLIGLILSAYPQNNFETTHKYDIVLTFTGDDTTGFTVTVSVNGWLIHDQNGELIE